jgi:hydrogenase expression/formation protein HypC
MCLGIPGQLKQLFVEEGLRMGRVSFEGVTRPVCLELLPQAALGDYVLVHVGFALSVIDPDEARKLLELIADLEPSEQTE